MYVIAPKNFILNVDMFSPNSNFIESFKIRVEGKSVKDGWWYENYNKSHLFMTTKIMTW